MCGVAIHGAFRRALGLGTFGSKLRIMTSGGTTENSSKGAPKGAERALKTDKRRVFGDDRDATFTGNNDHRGECKIK